MDELIDRLNGCLNKTTSILSLVSNSRTSDITASISQTTIELVTGISSALQQAGTLSQIVQDQMKSTGEAIEAVKNLKNLVKMQKATIDSFHLRESNMKCVGVNTDPLVLPEKKCDSCETLRKSIESLESNITYRTTDWKRMEDEWKARQASYVQELAKYETELNQLNSKFATSEQKCKQMKLLIEKTNNVIAVQQDKITSLEQWQQQKLKGLLRNRGDGDSGRSYGYAHNNRKERGDGDSRGRLVTARGGENCRNYEEQELPPPPPPAITIATVMGKPPRSPASPGTIVLRDLDYDQQKDEDESKFSSNPTSETVHVEHRNNVEIGDDDGSLAPFKRLESTKPLSPSSKSPRSPSGRPMIHNIYELSRASPLEPSRTSVPSSSSSMTPTPTRQGVGRYAAHAEDSDDGDDGERTVDSSGAVGNDESGDGDGDADSTVFGMLEDGDHEHDHDHDRVPGTNMFSGNGVDSTADGGDFSPLASVESRSWNQQQQHHDDDNDDEVSMDGSIDSTGSFSMIQQYYYDNNLDDIRDDEASNESR